MTTFTVQNPATLAQTAEAMNAPLHARLRAE